MYWSLDLADERLRVLLARTPAARLALLREQARERLAEVDAMVRMEKPAAATRAAEAYLTLLEAVDQVLQPLEDSALLQRHAEDLLAHAYMLSTDYVDLPRAIRPLLLPLLERMNTRYDAVARRLPQRTREALFFKEEEVRWSRDMAVAADEQGL